MNETSTKAPTSVKKEALSFIKTIIIFLAAALILRASVVEAFKIPSGSMIPTLRIGDYILVSKLTYGLRLPLFSQTVYQFSEPKRGEIVVFVRPDDPDTFENEENTNVIKRVLGVAGDTVEVKGAQLFLNGAPLAESYARWQEGGIAEGNFGPVTVPAGHVLLLGDNRDHSKDSRFWPDPFLPISRIKGRALIIYWSWDSLSRIGNLIR